MATHKYYAKSILASKTFWVNVGLFIIAVLELSEVTTIVPDSYQGLLLAIGAIVNVALRTFTVRPVAMIGPTQTKAVKVEGLP